MLTLRMCGCFEQVKFFERVKLDRKLESTQKKLATILKTRDELSAVDKGAEVSESSKKKSKKRQGGKESSKWSTKDLRGLEAEAATPRAQIVSIEDDPTY